MSFTIPTVDDFKAQFSRSFPYAVPAWGALAAATIAAGIVTSVSLTAGGQGYATSPAVVFTPQAGDTGQGASGHAVTNQGLVTSVVVDTGGSGYALPPAVSFSGGAGSSSDPTRVQDADILGGIIDAQVNYNPALFQTQQAFNRGFLYLAAHQMIEKLLMEMEGVQSQYEWLQVSKTVGPVSGSYNIPARILEDPFWSNLCRTRYGAMYTQMVVPQLIGNVITAHRFTLP